MNILKIFILLFTITYTVSFAQVSNWQIIIKQAKAAVQYYSNPGTGSFTLLSPGHEQENSFSFIKEFSDKNVKVKLTFIKYGTHIQLNGEAENLNREEICFTLKIIFPAGGMENLYWSYALDSSEAVNPGKIYGNLKESKTIVPPAGAFNTIGSNGGYGDNVGTGQMSFCPVAALSSDKAGLAWAVDMGLPVVFRLTYNPSEGIISEYDFALSKETVKFPNRAFFKLLLFEYDPAWKIRAAFEKYYTLQPEYFKRRLTQQGIWLPFAPLFKIKGWEDFGFAYHELHYGTQDNGVNPPLPAIEADKKAQVLTFQYTEPWEEEIPVPRLNLTYNEVTGKDIITAEHERYMKNAAAFDKEGRYITRKLETPWFTTGWAVSVNTNTDPDIKGYNRYDFVADREMNPALKMGADGIYFDCLEWHWQYDMNYNRDHFKYTDYPLTFSSSLEKPRPLIWSYASDYEFINRVADDMHTQGKYVMGNSFYWIPFSAGKLDLFGSELSIYNNVDLNLSRFLFLRAMAYQKPAVFLLNEGMDDKIFTQAPYPGYKLYFDKMLFFGFYPSFFSTDASNNIYWADSTRYNTGRPYFKKYIPLIKEIAAAGWQPVTYAVTNNDVKIERFGSAGNSELYFTLYNNTPGDLETTVTVDAIDLNIESVKSVTEMLDNNKVQYSAAGNKLEMKINVGSHAARLVKISK